MGQPKKTQSQASHKPRKGNSDYTYDDLVNTAGFEHMFSFLNARHPDAPDRSSAPEVGALSVTAPNINITGAVTSRARTLDAPNMGVTASDSTPASGAVIVTAPIVTAPEHIEPTTGPSSVIPFPALVSPQPLKARPRELGALDIGAPDLSASPTESFDLSAPGIIYQVRRYPVRPARTAQDGHTIGEQELYEALWRRSTQVATHAHAITIGERTIARELFQTPRSYSSVQENLRSLAAKLAIEVRPGRPNAPKTYIIYSYEEILKRRRQSGLTHYRKRASAVELITDEAASGAVTLDAPELSISAPDLGAPLLSATAPTIGAPQATVGAPTVTAHIRNRTNTSLATSASPVIVTALRSVAGRSDDQAALQIARDCRLATSDVTDDEIAHFIHQEAPAIINNKRLANPMGVLIRHIPRCCAGESLRQHRDTVRKRQELEQSRWRETASKVLEDPDASADDLQWAHTILENQTS